MNQRSSINQIFELGHGINWVIFTVLLFLTPLVTAQIAPEPPPPPPPPMANPLDPKIKVSPSMAIVLVCLISAFFIMGCASVYVRQCAESRLAFSPDVPGVGRRYRRSAARGLDPDIIDTFPTFLYSAVKGRKLGKAALECAVCLNEFEEDETLRLLPKCNHVFHPDCIDAWLTSHITCPVCRANLLPQPGELAPVTLLSQDSVNWQRSPENQDSIRATTNDMIIVVEAPEVINPTQIPNQNRPPKWTPPKRRSSVRFPRSHSTGHSVINPGEDCERFTLRLPEEVRRELMNTGLSRTKSCVVFPRSRSSRKGYRSSSSGGTGRDKNYEGYERFDRDGRSDGWGFTMTPPFFSRAGSTRSSKGGGDDLTATPKSLFRSVKSPFDRLFGGTDKDNNVGERSSDRLRSEGQL